MASTSGHFVRLSVPRRMIGDMLFAGRQLTLTTIERRMQLGTVLAVRSAAQPRPSWCALFTKALASVAARHPELRRVYVSWPWPRLFEYEQNTAGIVIERSWQGESTLFLTRVGAPESMSVFELDAQIRRCKERPIEEMSSFRGALRLARAPHVLRRLFWWLVMNALPRLRAKLLGTMGISVTAGMGAAGLFVIAPWTFTLHYDVFDPAGALDVRLTFDHRVIDGAILATALAEMERALCGPILAELQVANNRAADVSPASQVA